MPPVPGRGTGEAAPLPTKVTPEGSAPVSVKVGVGIPVVVTVNVPAVPVVKVGCALVIGGRRGGHRQGEALGGVGVTPLAAVMVIG